MRIVDIAWSTAGLSSIYDGSAVRIPTSAYSISVALARTIDFWDADATAIGEDMHTMLKAYFDTGGAIEVETIWSPASCLDVVGAHGQDPVRAYMADMLARFWQAQRHMQGMLDSGYVLARLLSGSYGQAQALGRTMGPGSGAASPYALSALRVEDLKSIEALELGSSKGGREGQPAPTLPRLPFWRTLLLCCRLYHVRSCFCSPADHAGALDARAHVPAARARCVVPDPGAAGLFRLPCGRNRSRRVRRRAASFAHLRADPPCHRGELYHDARLL